MSEAKCCSNCGYISTNQYDDFFDYQGREGEMTTCYFCIEMTSLEKNPKKSDKVTYEMFSQGMHWLLNNIREINHGKNEK